MLGVIADDFTGASDIASFLVENGLSTVQMNGVPKTSLNSSVGAVVISLKSRSNPVNEAIEQSLSALQWLKENGCTKFYFKYCSTFDSTYRGNIGPVTDALLDALNENFTVVTPALPVNGRTIFNGYLFVGNVLLSESGMRNHPITPMKDSNLVRLMDSQSKGKTGLVPYSEVIQGAERVKARFAELRSQGYRYAVVDAIDNSQLAILAEAIADLKLVTGGSGLGAYMAARLSSNEKGIKPFVPQKDKAVVLSGHIYLDVEKILSQEDYIDELYNETIKHLNEPLAPIVYATVPPEKLHDIQEKFGGQRTSHAIENAFAKLAIRLKNEAGVVNFITAGGETSSIIVQKLGFTGFHIGKQIAPGVPWLKALDENISLALKSGNFGKEDFFEFAQGMLV